MQTYIRWMDAVSRWAGVIAAWALLAACPQPPQPVGEEVLAAVATTEHPDGVVATLAAAALPQPSGRAGFVLALDHLQDPGNLGTLLRTALAAGVEEVWLGGGADPLQPKVLRASAGAALALPLRRAAERAELQGWLAEAAGRGQQAVQPGQALGVELQRACAQALLHASVLQVVEEVGRQHAGAGLRDARVRHAASSGVSPALAISPTRVRKSVPISAV